MIRALRRLSVRKFNAKLRDHCNNSAENLDISILEIFNNDYAVNVNHYMQSW